MEWYPSVCPYDCPDACGLLIGVEEGKVVAVKGNPNHAFTRGALCPKMGHYEKTVHHEGRLKTPLKRIGKKGEGRFCPISWEEAIQTIVSHIKENMMQYGGESILGYSFAGTMGLVNSKMGTAFFNAIGATRQDQGICSPAKAAGWTSVMGSTLCIRAQEMGDSDMPIIWGMDSVITDFHIMNDVKKARAKGAKLWVIDIRESHTMRFADERILLQPGSDGAFALAVLHILDRDGLVDKEFIDKYVQGYDGFSKEELPKYTPEWASEITGVAWERIEEFAHAYGTARAPYIHLGSGLTRYANGAMTIRSIACLPAVVGAYAKKGGGILESSGGSTFLNVQSVDFDSLFPRDNARPRLMPMIRLGEALTTWNDPPIKMIYIFSSNPAITAPAQNKVRAGLEREDLFTVVHERFMTDTAKYADIVLPATSSVEHTDVYYSYGHYTFGVGYACIPKVGESKSNWEVFRLLAKELGLYESIFEKDEEALVKQFVEAATGITEEQKEELLLGKPVEVVLPEGYKMKFGTSSGKIEIYNDAEMHPYPTYIKPHGDDAEFWLINAPDIRILDSSFNERIVCVEGKPVMVALMHIEDMEAKNIQDGDAVHLYNVHGKLQITVQKSTAVQKGTIVVAGVWSQDNSSDAKVGINALISDRPTDKGNGSTFYDVKVNIEKIKDINKTDTTL